MGAYVYVELFDMKVYQERAALALESFFRDADIRPLAHELEDVAKLDISPDRRAEIDDCLDILNGRVVYSPSTGHRAKSTSPEDLLQFVQLTVVNLLVELACVSRRQMVSKSRLPLFLYEHSSWIEEYLTFCKLPSGGSLEYPSGEGGTVVFTAAEIVLFLSEMRKMPPPPMEISAEFDSLVSVLGSADYAANRVIALSVA